MGRGAVDQYDGFALLEVCYGGFVCVCEFFARRLYGFTSLSFFFLLANLDFVILMVVDL